MGDLEETIQNLENRIAHLENELDTNYEEEKFSRRVSGMFPDADEVVVNSGNWGYHAHAKGLTTDRLNHIVNKLEAEHGPDYDYEITETGHGLGLEVWTETFK